MPGPDSTERPQIRNELARAVYPGISARDLQGPRLHFVLDKTPFFVENEILANTVKTINER
eukprot:749395-Hanusia_phi.AAC.3